MREDEVPSRIEPCRLDTTTDPILDLVAEISTKSALLGKHLHPDSAQSLAALVRVMNCYYSNLIEGHNTTLREIEKALNNEFDPEESLRNLQLEARAHIRVQRQLDLDYANNKLGDPASVEFIQDLHRQFYLDASEAMLAIRATDRELLMTPGKFRQTQPEDVAVGVHLPPASTRVADFMDYFALKYGEGSSSGQGSRILAIAAAHHRFNFIHPFLDGNGRVSRLMSHAMALKAGIGAHGLWSISRGLARGLQSRGDYKAMMHHADMRRQGDLDGRGSLSRRALSEFTEWFLKICLDQITFMSGLFKLEMLNERFKLYMVKRELRPESAVVLEQILLRGELPRGEVTRLTGLKERSARDLLGALVLDGIVGSETPKGHVSLRFPASSAELLFPSLYPET